ncbi:MAG: hypothetical protein C4523_06485 [Myxococcales bacterium]|nr:MAG: hypothetical protein C4523_06485 [Myxococcales bacterium]
MRKLTLKVYSEVEPERLALEGELADLLADTDAARMRRTLRVLAMVVRWLHSGPGDARLTLTARDGALVDSIRIEQQLMVTMDDEWPMMRHIEQEAAPATIRAA